MGPTGTLEVAKQLNIQLITRGHPQKRPARQIAPHHRSAPLIFSALADNSAAVHQHYRNLLTCYITWHYSLSSINTNLKLNTYWVNTMYCECSI